MPDLFIMGSNGIWYKEIKMFTNFKFTPLVFNLVIGFCIVLLVAVGNLGLAAGCNLAYWILHGLTNEWEDTFSPKFSNMTNEKWIYALTNGLGGFIALFTVGLFV